MRMKDIESEIFGETFGFLATSFLSNSSSRGTNPFAIELFFNYMIYFPPKTFKYSSLSIVESETSSAI
jgi:hypothetical protein